MAVPTDDGSAEVSNLKFQLAWGRVLRLYQNKLYCLNPHYLVIDRSKYFSSPLSKYTVSNLSVLNYCLMQLLILKEIGLIRPHCWFFEEFVWHELRYVRSAITLTEIVSLI